jgi:hypothetical protein
VAVSPRDAPWFVAVFDELRRLGFVEGARAIGKVMRP